MITRAAGTRRSYVIDTTAEELRETPYHAPEEVPEFSAAYRQTIFRYFGAGMRWRYTHRGRWGRPVLTRPAHLALFSSPSAPATQRYVCSAIAECRGADFNQVFGCRQSILIAHKKMGRPKPAPQLP